MLLSVLIPVYNEENNLDPLYRRIKSTVEKLDLDHELLFVNDGSKDGSIEIIKQLQNADPSVKYIDFSRNFGQQIALSAAIDHCKGDAAVIIDADLQDPPELIEDLVAEWRRGYQVVSARRLKREGETLFKTFTAKLFYRIMKRMTKIEIPLDTGDFRLIDRKIINVLKDMPEPNKFLRGQIAWVGYNQTQVTYERAERVGGESGYTFRKMLNFALDGITAFSDTPLKIVSMFGLLASVFAFIMIIYALVANLILHETVRGWTSLMIAVLFIGGIQMVAIGVIGEYLSRINDSVRDRPLYVISDAKL
jgi:dolichol-phosphate mannosyltransferase